MPRRGQYSRAADTCVRSGLRGTGRTRPVLADEIPAAYSGPRLARAGFRLPRPPASPTKIPQLRVPDPPHRYPTDKTAFRGTPGHSW